MQTIINPKTGETIVLPEPKAKPEPINNTERVETFLAEGGRILHVPPVFHKRGITFAYKLKNSRIEVATAVQHRSDCFTKKMGTKTAIEHFAAGKTITLPIYSNLTDVSKELEYLAYRFQ